MKELYRNVSPLPSFLQGIGVIVCGAAYVVCCLPSFYWIGKFALQIISSVLLSLVVTALVFYFIPRSLKILSGGLSVFLMVMLIFAVYRQIIAQIASGGIQLWWIHTFFYDRPFTVSVVWGAAFTGILLLRLFLPYDEKCSAFRNDFAVFFQNAFRWFLVFYAFVLIYCFILQRKPSGQSGFNLIPFAMLTTYFQSFRYSYETVFYFVGNVLCFLPVGFYVYVRRSDTSLARFLLTPIILSLLIESSQLLLGMGHFDVDDIIMNAVGFYCGYWIARLFDFVRSRITAGEEKSIFFAPQAIE